MIRIWGEVRNRVTPVPDPHEKRAEATLRFLHLIATGSFPE